MFISNTSACCPQLQFSAKPKKAATTNHSKSQPAQKDTFQGKSTQEARTPQDKHSENQQPASVEQWVAFSDGDSCQFVRVTSPKTGK